MLSEYNRILDKIPAVVKPLMSPHLVKLDTAMEPGLCMLTWTSMNLASFLESVYETLGEVELMVDRINDLVEFRIEKVLNDIANTKLVELPVETPWTTDQLIKNTEV